MKRWFSTLPIIALACSLNSCAAWHRDIGPCEVTIQGDFYLDTVAKPTLDDDITHPVKVPWHEGMTLEDALEEAHLRVWHGTYIHVHRGSEDLRGLVGKHGKVSSQVLLEPGDRITAWWLEF